MIPHTYVPTVVQTTDAESRVAARARGGSRELVFDGCRVSVWGDEQVLEMDGGDDCTTLCMYVVPLTCALKNGEFPVI